MAASAAAPVETMIVMEAFGRALALEPYLATVVLGGGFLRHGASEAQRAELIPQIAAGELHACLRAHRAPVALRPLRRADDGKARRRGLSCSNGEKSVVVHGDSADKLVVTARTAGGRRDRRRHRRSSSSTRTRPGVSRRGYPTQDGQRAAEVSLANVRVGAEAVIGDAGRRAAARRARRRRGDRGALRRGGRRAWTRCTELTVDYLKTRKQFGVPIGSFQALQHRGADMFVALEQARCMAMFATMMAQDENAAERRKAISAAKVQIGRSGRFVGQQAIQLHGGIGMTMEFKVGHYFKRVTMIDTLFGDADHHLALVAEAGGLV